MIGVKVDTSDLAREEKDAARILGPGGAMRRAIEKRLQQAAVTERFTHRYQNQTGHLQQSTAAVVVSEDDDTFEMHLEMGEEYASYVAARGFSDFEQIAEEALADVDQIIADMSEKL